MNTPGCGSGGGGQRVGRCAHQAVKQAREYVQAGYEWVVDIDLEKYFDRVNHDMLMARVARVMMQQDVEMSPRESGRCCGIYTSDGTMIGVVDFIPANFKGNSQPAFLSLLMIAAIYPQRGLGERIVKWIEAEIKKDGQVRTIFSAVHINNPGALRFWQKIGHQIISDPEAQTDITMTYRLHNDI